MTFGIPDSVSVSGTVLGTFEKWFYNALRALQVNQAKKDYPGCSLRVRVSHILESTVKRQSSWDTFLAGDYLRLPYSYSFLSNIIYSPFTLVPPPPVESFSLVICPL